MEPSAWKKALTTAIAVAIATGIGLVATRSTSTGDPRVLSSVAGIVALYLIAVTLSGWQYLRLQKRLRAQWRQRLYRFIPSEDYAAMVTKPAAEAERPYHFMGVIGLMIAVALILLAYVGWTVAAPKELQPAPAKQQESSSTIHSAPPPFGQTLPQRPPRNPIDLSRGRLTRGYLAPLLKS